MPTLPDRCLRNRNRLPGPHTSGDVASRQEGPSTSPRAPARAGVLYTDAPRRVAPWCNYRRSGCHRHCFGDGDRRAGAGRGTSAWGGATTGTFEFSGTAIAGGTSGDPSFCPISACSVVMSWTICSCFAASCSILPRTAARSRAIASSCCATSREAAALGGVATASSTDAGCATAASSVDA